MTFGKRRERVFVCTPKRVSWNEIFKTSHEIKGSHGASVSLLLPGSTSSIRLIHADEYKQNKPPTPPSPNIYLQALQKSVWHSPGETRARMEALIYNKVLDSTNNLLRYRTFILRGFGSKLVSCADCTFRSPKLETKRVAKDY